MKCNQAGINIIKKYETKKLKSYLCPAGIWTIGYGHTGPEVGPGQVITDVQAELLLRRDLDHFEKGVTSLLKVPVTENQFSALVSFAFNVGLDIDSDIIPEGLGDSTLLKLLNEKKYLAAADEFPKWDKCKGKRLNGLTKRRKEERELFLS